MLSLRKKLLAILTTIIIVCSLLGYGRPLFAQESVTEELLLLIKQDTAEIVAKLNYFEEVLLRQLLEFIGSWLAPLEPTEEKSPETVKLLDNFINYITYSKEYDETQLGLQPNFMKEYFNTAKLPAYANEVSFSTLLNAPLDTKDKDLNLSSYNYIKNVSGFNLQHLVPQKNWGGSPAAIEKYTTFYKTISAVQSFNTYVLSALYVDRIKNYSLSTTQKNLMDIASSEQWFEEVASEEIGVVLRKILLFNSQTYVLLIKLLELQKQQAASQAITNTLLIMGNQFTEKELVNSATGSTPANRY